MSRPLRIAFPGALYQLTARGDARQDIFLDSDDARLFPRLLADRFGVHHSTVSRAAKRFAANPEGDPGHGRSGK